METVVLTEPTDAKPLPPNSVAITVGCEDRSREQSPSPAKPMPQPKPGSVEREDSQRQIRRSDSRSESPTANKRVKPNHKALANARSNLSPSPSPRSTRQKNSHSLSAMANDVAENRTNLRGSDQRHPHVARCESPKVDKRFDSFKTWSGRLERQISNLRGVGPAEPSSDVADDVTDSSESDELPAHRYFDALQGPELDTLRDSEEPVLPEEEQWPFLLRFPISSFGICLGVGSQAILWKAMATAKSLSFLHIGLSVNRILWCIALISLATITSIYLLKIIFYFEAVRREYYHPIRVNFFFAPWISLLFLGLGIPPSISPMLHPHAWYLMMAPILLLELKIYGQWMSGGQRRLSMVANPSNHLSIIGNFVGALLGATMGLREGPVFFFAIGVAHYVVLFVTLYQRLPTNETLSVDLHPVFFLFVAAPSVASMAWAKICGEFGYVSRIAYFISIFLYLSLVVRVNFFTGFRFSLAWWAYTFPMAGASIATIRYSDELMNPITRGLSIALSLTSTATVIALLCTTLLRAFVFRDLFPNDISIAISGERKKKPT